MRNPTEPLEPAGDARLLSELLSAHQDAGGTYGSPRLHRVLQGRGLLVGRHRVMLAMRRLGLAVSRRSHGRGREGQLNRARTCRTSACVRRCVPDLVRRRFATGVRDRAWVVDVSVVMTTEGPRHLAVLLDLGSRRVLSWALALRPDARLATRALAAAIRLRRPKRGLIVHSDRGGAFASRAFQAGLSRIKARASMSRRHNPWDNAVAESLFATLKCELLHRLEPASVQVTRTRIGRYFEWYNHHRLHSSLGYMSPVQFEAANR